MARSLLSIKVPNAAKERVNELSAKAWAIKDRRNFGLILSIQTFIHRQSTSSSDVFEICGVPDYDPSVLAHAPKRHGTRIMVWPMFDIDDPVRALEVFCSVLEQMNPTALEHWYALPDRFLHLSAGDVDKDASQLESVGFTIPGDLIRHIRRLRLRVQVTFHPHTPVIVASGFS